MKLDGSFELKTLAGQSIVVPGKLKNVDFTNLLTLNETAAVVWERMTQGEFEVDDLVKALTDAYEVDEAPPLHHRNETLAEGYHITIGRTLNV